MACAGVGVDMVEIARMERVLERTPRFRERVFTAEERAYCDGRARPAESYAARFAAREAVLKALGCGFAGMGLADVSVVPDPRTGPPKARLAGAAARLAAERGVVEVALSLSHTRDVAQAIAVAVTEDARPPKEERPDPAAELTRSFKEARSVLDDLERVQETEWKAAQAAQPAPAGPEEV
ncbi:holo-ACP synthase [Olsenella sp. CU969]|uniref:holo-ACP synthase n=1 Tax=Olsenella sp. CU969 TaxID=2780101 RepID=UPI00195AC242|nr:holo-ACP synthase [Olsenella sp. CU969]